MSPSNELIFFVNGKKVVEKNADPEEMLVGYLRRSMGLTGTKSSCGSGGCGACTVMVSRYDPLDNKILHYAVNACLQPIVTLHGVAVVTVEGVGSTKTKLHPVQERIAFAHGSQCGFCTPGMVMSVYTLLRNKPSPNMEDLRQALTGNLCRCTGYRPIIDGVKTFCSDQSSQCCQNGAATRGCCVENGTAGHSLQADMDPSQHLIFPPQLIMMQKVSSYMEFQGHRVKFMSPVEMSHLLQLKAQLPHAALVVGNTTTGPQMLKGDHHYDVIIYAGRISELRTLTWNHSGVSVGAACTLSQLKEEMERVVKEEAEEKTRGFTALLKTLETLGATQIRNTATVGGNIVSANPKYDLSSILAALQCTLTLASTDGERTLPLNQQFYVDFGKTVLRPDEILLSVHIPYTTAWEFVWSFRQAQRRELSFSMVNSGMKVKIRAGCGEVEGLEIRGCCGEVEGLEIRGGCGEVEGLEIRGGCGEVEGLEIRGGCGEVEGLEIYYGGVGATLLRASATCQALHGRRWGEELLAEGCGLLQQEVQVPPEVHGGRAEFRLTLVLSFFYCFYLKVLHMLHHRGASVNSVPPEFLSALTPFKNDLPQGHHSYQVVPDSQSSGDPVGRPSMHLAALQQATGEACYYDDLPQVKGELFIVMVTSTKAHAKITAIDQSEALLMPGVVDFLSAADVPGSNRRRWFNDTEELFAEEEVVCVGQIIGAVVAENREQAHRAAQRVHVTYTDLLPVYYTIEEAIKHQSFFEPQRKLQRGDVDAALLTAPHVLEGQMYMGGQEHFYMETQGLIAVPSGENGEMDVFVASQHTAFTQELVAGALGVSSNKITCHVKRLGGGFGGKVMKIASLSAITAVAAAKTGRAVRCCLQRGEDMLITSGRHPFLGKYKVGYKQDGTIVAADITYYSNGGSSLDESCFIMEKALLHMDNGYQIPNLRGRGVVCRTFLPSYTAFRGFGAPQGAAVIESVVHEVAVRCGLPAEKVREINMYTEHQSLTHHGQLFSPTAMQRCWAECLQKAAYQQRLSSIQTFNQDNRWRKRGICAMPLKFGVGFSKGFYNQGAALVNVFKDGSVLLAHGGTEMGQGIHTKAIQIASRVLQVPMSIISIKETCTGTIPNATPSAASFGTDSVGMAVKDACEKLMRRLEPVMKKYPQYTWTQWIVEAYYQKISLSATGFFMGPPTSVDWEKGEGEAYYYYTFGACCSEVEIDCLTGDHKNIRTDIVMDVGKSINPALDIGQIEGGFVQGLGLYTIEELQFSPQGVLRTRGPSQYKIPALCDVPPLLNVHLLHDTENPHAVYMSKGIGEPPVSFGCTVFFAIKQAIAAARRDAGLEETFTLNSPATAHRIRMACQDQFTHMASSMKPTCTVPWSINV